MKKIWLIFLISIGCNGCINQKEKVVRIELIQPPEIANNVLYIATNEQIPVALQGQDEILKLNVGGYYLLPRTDLEVLLKTSQKYLRIKNSHSYSEVLRIIEE